MITRDLIYSWLGDPTTLTASVVTKEELKELIELYPYCEPVYWLYLRYLYQNDDITFEQELMRYGMYLSDRRWFYEFMTYRAETAEDTAPVLPVAAVISAPTDYFAITRDSDKQQTLQQLAIELKQARMARAARSQQEKPQENNIADTKAYAPQTASKTENADEKTLPADTALHEEEAIKLIKEKKYSAALEILKAINLNNPKKSTYFALQIKYLETIINNNK